MENYIDLLAIATKYIIPKAREEAIRFLDEVDKEKIVLKPTRRLYLARQYHVKKWVHPALTNIYHTTPYDMVAEDYALLPPEIIRALSITQLKAQAHRGHIVCSPWQVTHIQGCKEAECAQGWATAWFECTRELVQYNLSTKSWASDGYAVLDTIKKRAIPGMTNGCKALTIKSLIAYEALWRDRVIIEKALRDMEQLCAVTEINMEDPDIMGTQLRLTQGVDMDVDGTSALRKDEASQASMLYD
jgi:hypothetical protein